MRQNPTLKLAGSLTILAASFAFAVPVKAFYLETPKFFRDTVNLIQSVSAEEKMEIIAPAVPQTIQQPPYFQPQPTQPQPNFQGDNDKQKIEQDEQRRQDEQNKERMLKDIQRGARDIERQLKRFELMIANFTKKKIVISEEIKTKVADLKSLVEKYKTISTVEDAASIDPQEMWDKMRDLEEERQNLERTENVLREMRRIESGIKMFEKQVQRLIKQKIAVSAEITANLEQVKALISDIKNGKMENAEEIFELMQNLDEHRGELEMLARWPQTMKQMDMELRKLTRELKRVKPMVARLVKKGIELTSVYNNFESAINKLTEVKNSAAAKISEDAEGVFESVQNDFFSQLKDVWDNYEIIIVMSNFSRFDSDFKREIANDSWQINLLKKKKINTTELEDMLEQAKAKGGEASQLFKAKPLDPDAVIAALEDLQDLKQNFDQKMAELTGTEEAMPWEKGQQQFRKIDISPNLDKWIPKKAPQQQGQQTCNINGVEIPGPCEGALVKP